MDASIAFEKTYHKVPDGVSFVENGAMRNNDCLTNANIHYNHVHDYSLIPPEVVAPTCKEQGYTVYACECGYSYTSDYTDVTDHVYKDGYCTVCGEKEPSEGLVYELNADHKSYSVVSMGSCRDINVVVPSERLGKPITKIGDSAFKDKDALKTLVLPEGVISIGDEAFANCSSLIDIELSDSLIEIGSSAFENCYSLERILIPSGVEMKDAGSPAFVGTPLLKTIVFEEGREEISGAPYFNLNSGADIYIPKSVKRVSLSPFIVEDNTPIELIFLGDCPELIETHEKLGDPTVYYDVRTFGWESCAWRDVYPIKENQYLFIDGKENEVWKNCLEYFISNRALKQIEEGVGSYAVGLMDVTLDGVPEIFLAYRGGSMGNRPFQIYDLRSAQKLGYYDGSVGGGIYPVKSSDGEVIWLSEGCFRDPDLGIVDFLVRILPEFGERYLAADSLFHKAENRKDGKEALYSVGNENKTLSKAEYYEEYGKFRDSHRRIPFAEMKLVEWNSIEAESKQEIASEMAEALLEGYVGVVPNDLLTDLQQ